MARKAKLDTNEDGTQQFVSVNSMVGETKINARRTTAWRTIGQETIGALTAQQAIEMAGLDTTVTKQPCFAFVNGQYVEVEDKWVTGSPHPIKKELWRPHGVVGNSYEVVQNAEQFEMLDAIVDESGSHYETAGSLGNGNVVFVTMKMPTSLKFNGGEDVVDLYLFAQNSHDGTKAFTIAVTPIRLVCTNQLRAAVNNAKSVIRLKHTKNVMAKVTEARDALKLTFEYVDEFEREVKELISQSMTTNQFVDFAKSYAGAKVDANKSTLDRREKMVEQLVALWNAPTQEVAGKNKWGAYNAVTEYVDWFSGVRNTKSSNEEMSRAFRQLSVNADNAKNRAFQMLINR